MIPRSLHSAVLERTGRLLRDIPGGLPFVLRSAEVSSMEIADFGLSNIEVEGAQIITLAQTDRIAAKVLVLLPWQTEPEHRHPPVGSDPGKEETIRALWGDLLFFIPGSDTMQRGRIPPGKDDCYTCRHELSMAPGDQITLEPGTPHWFQAGDSGAVLLSLSTVARDLKDLFTDPDVVRATVIGEHDNA